MRKDYRVGVINILKEVAKKYEDQPLSTHIALALEDYPSFDGISDKELYFAIEKYKCTKELDYQIPHSNSIQRIIDDAKDLDSILDDEDEF